MASSRYLNRSTPGVYITEIEAFGSSIVGVATSVPIFIGYTQFAGDPQTGSGLYMKPTAISSMTEFLTYFGGAAPPVAYNVAPAPAAPPAGTPPPPPDPAAPVALATFNANVTGTDGTVAMTSVNLNVAGSAAVMRFMLYNQMRLFFANGGNSCFIVSVGSYWDGQFPVARPASTDGWNLRGVSGDDLVDGIKAAQFAIGPTMTVVPEAVLLNAADFSDVVVTMLNQASTLQDRVAILDLPGALAADTIGDLTTAQTGLSTAIAPAIAAASYGVAYAPAVNASVVAPTDVSFTSLAAAAGADNQTINDILTTQAVSLYPAGDKRNAVQSMIALAFPTATGTSPNTGPFSTDTSAYTPAAPSDPTDPDFQTDLAQWRSDLDKALNGALPAMLQIKSQVAAALNISPASGIMAGVWTRSDALNGVWNAPANMSLASVVSPLFAMNDDQQAGFNLPLNGQAINVLRAQPGRGTVVWGARTLDGNSNDYRYIQVRRTLIYIEQSIKTALQSYVFAPNDSTTWMAVNSAISSFLTSLWRSGGLMGAKPDEAFTVQVGLGSTMTAQDVLNGYMVVAVTLQMIHPAEFIELTFTQMMNS
jgi:hypothetical protein